MCLSVEDLLSCAQGLCGRVQDPRRPRSWSSGCHLHGPSPASLPDLADSLEARTKSRSAQLWSRAMLPPGGQPAMWRGDLGIGARWAVTISGAKRHKGLTSSFILTAKQVRQAEGRGSKEEAVLFKVKGMQDGHSNPNLTSRGHMLQPGPSSGILGCLNIGLSWGPSSSPAQHRWAMVTEQSTSE